jgi:hypothetical protein
MPPMPSVLVLVVCRVIFIGGEDDNSKFTNWRNTEWDLTHGVMHCRREQVELYDKAVDQGGDPMPFNTPACMRAAMTLGPQFDVENRDKPWRFWRAACPTPIMNDNGTPDNPRDDRLIGWQIPPCPEKRGVLECESDTEI